MINNTHLWSDHVDYIHRKTSKRLYFLTFLKRSGLSTRHLLTYYTSIIRPVVEYACPLWHNGLTLDQSNVLESIQKRALRIIFPEKSYQESVQNSVNTLHHRRDILCKSFFEKICTDGDRLNYLMNPGTTRRTRHSKQYATLRCRTQRLQNSFIPYALCNYQK